MNFVSSLSLKCKYLTVPTLPKMSKVSKVGRPPKSEDSRCLTKNAIAARLNRKKKKAYIESLENQAKRLDEEIDHLKEQQEEDERKTEEMNRDILYLKNIVSKISNAGFLDHDAPSTSTASPDSHLNL